MTPTEVRAWAEANAERLNAVRGVLSTRTVYTHFPELRGVGDVTLAIVLDIPLAIRRPEPLAPPLRVVKGEPRLCRICQHEIPKERGDNRYCSYECDGIWRKRRSG